MPSRLPNLRDQAIRRHMPRAGDGRDWYRFAAETDAATEIFIYDVIGWPWISADEFVRDLRALDPEPRELLVHVNSPGGDVFDGVAIYNALRDHPAAVEVRVNGIAASIASVIAMAADPGRLVMNRASTVMIHDPWSFVVGDARDMRAEAAVLDQLGDTIAGVYADRAGGGVAAWRERMLEETWYTAAEAVEAGLADSVAGADSSDDGEGAGPSDRRFDLSVYRNPPPRLQRPAAHAGGSRTSAPTVRDAERALREAGLSASAAKRVLARGWKDTQEDPARDERAARALIKQLRAHTRED